MEPEKLTVKVDFKALIERPHRVLWSYTQLASFGLTASAAFMDDVAAGRRDAVPLALPNALFQLEPKHVPTADTRSSFDTWLVGCVLRDVIEVVAFFLEEARQICAMYSLLGPADIAAEDWNATVFDEGDRFHRLGLPDKLKFMETRYGVALPADFTDEILTINRARNCLVHRNGLVTEKDTNLANAFTVKWRCLEVRAVDETGTHVVTKGMRVKKGTALGLALSVHSREFQLGERICFSTQELVEICTSIVFFTREFGLATERWANSRNVSSSG